MDTPSERCLAQLACLWLAITWKVSTRMRDCVESSLISRVVLPDHLGNNQRLFDKYGKIFKTTNTGTTVHQTNDPALALIVLTESEFFSKEIVPMHPLYPLKTQSAGVFLADTSSPFVKPWANLRQSFAAGVQMLKQEVKDTTLSQHPDRLLLRRQSSSLYSHSWHLS